MKLTTNEAYGTLTSVRENVKRWYDMLKTPGVRQTIVKNTIKKYEKLEKKWLDIILQLDEKGSVHIEIGNKKIKHLKP